MVPSSRLLTFDDGLDRDGCRGLASCRALVFALRERFHNYARTKRRFTSFTAAELRDLPEVLMARDAEAVAAIDLDRFASFDDVWEAARTVTGRKGRVTREVERARRAGYDVRPFPFALHVPDIHAIHHSKPVRSGVPMKPQYLKSIDQMGGAPTGPVAAEEPPCPWHHVTHWGAFRHRDGHRQGAVVTDARLAAYATVRRVGTMAWVYRIMGHADDLGHGVMYRLHYEILRAMVSARDGGGERWLAYHQYCAGPGDTLTEWKRRGLYRPYWIVYEDDRPLALRDAAGSRGARRPSADGPIARTTDFPVEALDGIGSVGAWVDGGASGAGDLAHLAAAGIAEVAAALGPNSDAAAVRRLFPPSWRLGPGDGVPAGRFDAVVLDPPGGSDRAVLDGFGPAARAARSRVVASLGRTALVRLGQKADGHTAIDAAAAAATLGAWHGVAVAGAAAHFRHRGAGGTYWLVVDLER